MSIIVTPRSFFSAGQGVVAGDFNDISLNTTRRAWEVPGYASLVGFDEVGSSGLRPYADAFDGDVSALYARMRGIFTAGRGLEPSFSGLWSGVGPGIFGIWFDPDGPAPPPATGSNRMMWATCAAGDIAVTHDPAGSSRTRWDLITLVPENDTDMPTVSRDFKDATTGAITTETIVPGKKFTFTTHHIAGEETTGTPDMPLVPEGEYGVYGALVDSTGVTKVWDLTVPHGTLKIGTVLGREGMSTGGELQSVSWTVAQNTIGIKSVESTPGDLLLFPPAQLRGTPDGLLLGIQLRHKLFSGTTVKLCSFPLGDGSITDLVDLTSRVTRDGTVRSKALDLRGSAYDDRTPPIWMNGTNKKGAADSTVCLRIGASSSTDISYLYSVQWFTL